MPAAGAGTTGASPPPSWAPAPAGVMTARVERALSTIELNAAVNAFTQVLATEARASAHALDERARRGAAMGPLYGATFAVKDIMAVRGQRTSAGTRAFRGAVAEGDAEVVRRLRAADGVLVGLTNLHALAYGPFSSSSDWGPVRNPLRLDAVAGGSRGGSAAAVAMGAVDLAVGTDTAGSIRMPAALCGVVGLKGGYGRAPMSGVQPLAPTLDHVGPIARTVTDTAAAWEVMTARGHDLTARREGLAGVIVAVLSCYVRDHLDPAVGAALDSALATAARLGAEVRSVPLPDVHEAPETIRCTIGREALDTHRALLHHRGARLPADVRQRLQAGDGISDADYVHAQHLRGRLRSQLRRLLRGADVLLLPTLPITAPALDALEGTVRSGQWTTREAMSRFTLLASLTGHPAVTIPWTRDEAGAGIGIQLVGDGPDEGVLLAIARTLEQAHADDLRESAG